MSNFTELQTIVSNLLADPATRSYMAKLLLVLAEHETEGAAASETAAGIVELATTAEAIAGTDTARAVTPAGLAAHTPAASETAAGKVELATTVEAAAGTDTARAVTAAGVLAAIAANGGFVPISATVVSSAAEADAAYAAATGGRTATAGCVMVATVTATPTLMVKTAAGWVTCTMDSSLT